MTANRKPSASGLREHTDVEGSQAQAQNTLFVLKFQAVAHFVACLAGSGIGLWLYLGIAILGGVL